MRSLQMRLLVGVVAALIVLLTVFSTYVYWGFRRSLFIQFDDALATIADIISASVELRGDEGSGGNDGHEIDVEFEVQRMAEFNNQDLPMNYQIWQADGSSVAKSPLLGEKNLPRPSNHDNQRRFYTVARNGVRPVRAICRIVHPKIEGNRQDEEQDEPTHRKAYGEQKLSLVVTRDLSDLYAKLHALAGLLMGGTVGTVGLSLGIGFLIVGQGLKPLKIIAGQIGEIGEHDLSVRIEAPSVPTEIEPIQIRLNALLDRLNTAFQRERRFTADAAHELRTPLAGLRSILEVCLTRPRDKEAYREALCESLSVSSDMQVMVENLLALARLEAKDVVLKVEPIRLSDLANTCWRPLSDKALEKGLQLDNQIDADRYCVSDPTYLTMVFTNCLNNAVAYTNAGGMIRINASGKGKDTEITFTNTGCTLTREEVSQCFIPFWRADVSRSASGNHCGLGLALVKRIVQVLGGEVSVRVNDQDEFCLTVILSE